MDEERVKQLKAIAPEAFADGKINWESLKEALGEHLEDEDENAEHFGLFWPGKREARKRASEPSKKTLVLANGEGIDEEKTKNIYIEGDNLEVLKLLQKAYAGKIKMIYIDPPYNTGKDFIYDDNFSESIDEYLKKTDQIDDQGKALTTNTKADGRFHSKWLSMMYPRLRLARNLLKESGAIFISIDDNEINNLKNIMNEIFGEENFIAQIAVVNNLKGRNDQKNVATCHEYLLIYSRTNQTILDGLPLTDEQKAEFKYTDESGKKYALRDLRKRGRPDRREDRPNMWFPIFYDEKNKKCTLERVSKNQIEITPKKGDGSDGRWRWGRERVADNLNNLEPRFSEKTGKWDIEHRVYLNVSSSNLIPGDDDLDEDEESTERSSKSKSIWFGGEISTDVGRRTLKQILPEVEYDYPKATEFIKRCLYLGLSNNEIVLDFFSGSSTTAQSLLELNAEGIKKGLYMCVQLPEKCDEKSNEYKKGFKTIADIGKERIRRVVKSIQQSLKQNKQLFNKGEPEFDLGLKVYKCKDTNFKQWQDYSGTSAKEMEDLFEKSIESIKNEANEADLLLEVMLLEGYPLTSTIEEVKGYKNTIKVVSDENVPNRLIVSFDKQIDKDTIKKLELKENEIFVCFDSAISDADKVKLSDKGFLKTI